MSERKNFTNQLDAIEEQLECMRCAIEQLTALLTPRYDTTASGDAFTAVEKGSESGSLTAVGTERDYVCNELISRGFRVSYDPDSTNGGIRISSPGQPAPIIYSLSLAQARHLIEDYNLRATDSTDHIEGCIEQICRLYPEPLHGDYSMCISRTGSGSNSNGGQDIAVKNEKIKVTLPPEMPFLEGSKLDASAPFSLLQISNQIQSGQDLVACLNKIGFKAELNHNNLYMVSLGFSFDIRIFLWPCGTAPGASLDLAEASRLLQYCRYDNRVYTTPEAMQANLGQITRSPIPLEPDFPGPSQEEIKALEAQERERIANKNWFLYGNTESRRDVGGLGPWHRATNKSIEIADLQAAQDDQLKRMRAAVDQERFAIDQAKYDTIRADVGNDRARLIELECELQMLGFTAQIAESLQLTNGLPAIQLNHRGVAFLLLTRQCERLIAHCESNKLTDGDIELDLIRSIIH